MKKKKDIESEVNMLELVPERLVDHEEDDGDVITLLSPRFKSRLMKKLLESRLKNRFLKVKLDEIGSSVWLLCDGHRSIGEIGEMMRERFGDKIEPCYDRLSVFFSQLEISRFIRYSNLEELLNRASDGNSNETT